ncbi:hypothetical protein M2319_000135 [Rhodobium gokarnense]|uniref:GSCFA domain-containing protein n=2 Tax=Rhodobium gokarnense TaxID=364296 RepID=A0ABT3H644_9HYPH|nr:hypothetical protein [Rhodobium gokarnense]
MPKASADAFNYGIFSFRTGNIYTTALLRQWVSWALKREAPPDEFWEKDGRYYDPFRPVVEPDGFASLDEARISRAGTIDAVRRAIGNAKVFVFTLGLTESWSNRETGIHYPMCPGTAAGEFDPDLHVFSNLTYPEILADLHDAITMMREVNPDLRFLLTVSPVPLTATATDTHVLVATTYSKSTLRAVAGDTASAFEFVDYFPSYEIVTNPCYRGLFFEPNMRSVAPEGVDFVMSSFFACLGDKGFKKNMEAGEAASPGKDTTGHDALSAADEEDDIACEEELLAAFGPESAVR